MDTSVCFLVRDTVYMYFRKNQSLKKKCHALFAQYIFLFPMSNFEISLHDFLHMQNDKINESECMWEIWRPSNTYISEQASILTRRWNVYSIVCANIRVLLSNEIYLCYLKSTTNLSKLYELCSTSSEFNRSLVVSWFNGSTNNIWNPFQNKRMDWIWHQPRFASNKYSFRLRCLS